MPSGITADLKRGASPYKINPKKLVVYGYDDGTPKLGQHPLARPTTPPTDDLIASVKRLGVKKTIWVTVIDKEFVVVVDGRRRTFAARAANLPEVEVQILKGSDIELLGFSFLANMGGHAEAYSEISRAAKKMLDAGSSLEDIAAFFQVGVPMVRLYLAFDELSAETKALVDKGEMSWTAATKLKGMSAEEQKVAIAKMREAGDLSVTAAESARAAKMGKVRKDEMPQVAPPPKKRALRKLVERWDEVDVDVREDFVLGIKFALGLVQPRQIKGLTEAMKKVTAKKPGTDEAGADAE